MILLIFHRNSWYQFRRALLDECRVVGSFGCLPDALESAVDPTSKFNTVKKNMNS